MVLAVAVVDGAVVVLPGVLTATLVVGLGVAVLDGSEVLGFVDAMPAVEGASFLPQAIQLGLDQLPILQPVLVRVRPTVSPRASERTTWVRNILQCIRGILSQTHRFPRRLIGETGEVFEQRNFGMRDGGLRPRMLRCIRNPPPACFGR